jgi:hypothetical protein
MRIAIYAHPADLDALPAHGGLQRLVDLGIGEVALAVSYHAGRWLTPWDPRGMVRFLEDGTVHFRPRGDYGPLVPLPSSHVPPQGPSPLERLCADAPRFGLATRAWTVLTHNTRLGERHRACAVENAFGDRYDYALCPAQPPVQRYVLAMVRDLAAHHGLHTIELEALGWMGWKHSSHHEKASYAPGVDTDQLLSFCWCPACSAGYAALGTDVGAARARVVDYLRARFTAGDAMAPPAWSEQDAHDPRHPERLAAPVPAFRRRVLHDLAAACAAASPHVGRAVHVTPAASPCGGSQVLPAETTGLRAGDEWVLTCYGAGPDKVELLLQHLHAARAPGAARPPLRLCIWPKAPEWRSDADLQRLRALCTDHGVGSVAIYHLGLLPWRTLERVARALTG